MNKKTIIISIYSLFLLLISHACTDDLSLTPISQISNTSFWQSEEEAFAGLNGMYARMRTQVNNIFVWGEARSENWVQNFGFDPSVNFYAYTNALSSANPGPNWTSLYSVVHDANLIIKYVPEIAFSSESEKNNIIAQAYTMRAYLYYIMTRTWGDVMLVTEPTEGFNPEEIYKERADQSVVFDLIKSDLEMAISLYSDDSYAEGRIMWSRPAANALKADVFLWTGKRLGGGDADFNEALSALEEIENSEVELLSDFGSIFEIDNNGNNEILMSVHFEEGESSVRTVLGGVTALAAPTYPNTAQEVIDKITPYSGKSAYWQVSSIVTEEFDEDDLRKESSVIEVYETTEAGTSLLYNIDQKWPGQIIGSTRNMYDDYIIYRYADVILMRAEAKNALGQDPSEEINLIRQRAYGDAFSEHVFVSASQEFNDEVILKERLLEFLNEGKYWWDLLRFGKAQELVPGLEGEDENALLYPIGSDILSLEPLIQQNPGY
ncbi:hypothetical protein OKW21_004197 [Catalinimonas alkaloidigena]|uniref:RagB/SusD family nutrient uptake outer membrane protein n=1 Tax=Catalinimonas alkaloidigena TaxID=1075417 RepID=UPI002404AE50|nr:RagB/SusD family nutrient uptake outer membrane protein [Catalinimonas alkaloidigena]MDF9798934.1 hypothetical protein [Catalinimonas alkaloidigena]